MATCVIGAEGEGEQVFRLVHAVKESMAPHNRGSENSKNLGGLDRNPTVIGTRVCRRDAQSAVTQNLDQTAVRGMISAPERGTGALLAGAAGCPVFSSSQAVRVGRALVENSALRPVSRATQPATVGTRFVSPGSCAGNHRCARNLKSRFALATPRHFKGTGLSPARNLRCRMARDDAVENRPGHETLH